MIVKIVTSHLFEPIVRHSSKLIKKYGIIQSSILLNTFPSKSANVKKQAKDCSCVKETQRHLRNSQSQNTSAPGNTEEYITQVSEEIESRVTKKLSQEFSRTECRILGALSKLDEFLLSLQIRTFSGIAPGTFRNADVGNREPSGDRFQNDPHLEVQFSAGRPSKSIDSDPEKTFHSYDQISGSTWRKIKTNRILFLFYLTVIKSWLQKPLFLMADFVAE